VSELLLSNEGDERVFLLDGEELVGAKQNRILNTSLLVERRTRLAVPVSCVERGRWEFRAGRSMRPGSVSHPALRGEKAVQIHESLRARGSYCSDQTEVWRHVDRKLRSLGADSESSALEAGFELHRSSLDRYAARLPCPEGAVGVAAAIAGRVACADLFATPALLARMLALHDDALLEAFVAPGLGASVRVQASRASGSALVVDGTIVHAELFAAAAIE